MAGAGALGLLLVVVLPEAAHAWGPATHVYLGLELLGSLDLIAAPTAALLSAHPVEFLYGSVAADIPLGKQYADDERHPHAWRTGWQMYEAAGSDTALRAAAVGYLTHLAADVNAHEVFVPRMLLLTASSKGVGHSYWEHRMDREVAREHLPLARSLVLDRNNSRADELLDRVLDRTLLSFEANRRIFHGMVRVLDDHRWRTLFGALTEISRWELDGPVAQSLLRATYGDAVEFLRHGRTADVVARDPTGEAHLDRAKDVRRRILRRDGLSARPTLLQAADRLYPVPEPGDAWRKRGTTPLVAKRAREAITPGVHRLAG